MLHSSDQTPMERPLKMYATAQAITGQGPSELRNQWYPNIPLISDNGSIADPVRLPMLLIQEQAPRWP